MDFFKLGKGESAIIKILHTSIDTIPLVKVHTVPNRVNGSIYNIPVKCNAVDGKECALCASYPKMEYIRVLTLYDFRDGNTKVFKTTSKALMAGIDEAIKEWGTKLNDLTFKISRESNEFGTYGIAVVPSTKYTMTTAPEVEVDTDTTYRLGLYRTNDEMKEYLKTGVMPKHQKSEGAGTFVGSNVDYFAPKTNVVAPTTASTKAETQATWTYEPVAPIKRTPTEKTWVDESVTLTETPVPTTTWAPSTSPIKTSAASTWTPPVDTTPNPPISTGGDVATFTAPDDNFVMPF